MKRNMIAALAAVLTIGASPLAMAETVDVDIAQPSSLGGVTFDSVNGTAEWDGGDGVTFQRSCGDDDVVIRNDGTKFVGVFCG